MRALRIPLPWFVTVVAVAAVGGVTFGAFREIPRILFGRPSFAQSVTKDDSTYYRLKVKLAYKGEPQDFDIVVGCNVRQINYKDGGSTYEVGLMPTVFGRRMNDGKLLVVRPPSACRGETTANGQVPPDLLPVVVVYDNADRLDFGIAYLSEDAYENPRSVLKFGGATITKSTRAEFDEFRRTQTNAVRRELYHSALDSDQLLAQLGLPRVARTWAHVCEGYKRFRISEELRPLVRSHWPEGAPKYWQASTFEVEREIGRAILGSSLRSDRPDDTPHSAGQFGPIPENEANYGLPSRAGGGVIHLVPTARTTRFPPAYYPAANDYRLDQWPADRKEWPGYVASRGKLSDTNISVDGRRSKGFAYCYVTLFPSSEIAPQVVGRRIVGRVDGQEIDSQRASLTAPDWIFERDEYVFFFFRFYLESTRGDV
jgi:hypothetical protein